VVHTGSKVSCLQLPCFVNSFFIFPLSSKLVMNPMVSVMKTLLQWKLH